MSTEFNQYFRFKGANDILEDISNYLRPIITIGTNDPDSRLRPGEANLSFLTEKDLKGIPKEYIKLFLERYNQFAKWLVKEINIENLMGSLWHKDMCSDEFIDVLIAKIQAEMDLKAYMENDQYYFRDNFLKFMGVRNGFNAFSIDIQMSDLEENATEEDDD